jgi:DNA-binding transcriptional LysR family regulator
VKNATLRQLKVFEAVARLLSFSRAAEELFLSQPAVSIQIRKLEEHAGNALFEQFGKKIYLTPAGTELLRISRAIIQQFEAAENAMTQFRGVSGGRLNVGVISAGDYFFPRLLVEFAGRHSGVVLNFTVHNREELLARIADNLTDLGIMVRRRRIPTPRAGRSRRIPTSSSPPIICQGSAGRRSAWPR